MGRCLAARASLPRCPNAVDAAAERGDGKGLVTVRFGLRDSIASVSVEDNGTGVAPEIAEHLLEPFQTTKSKGMDSVSL